MSTIEIRALLKIFLYTVDSLFQASTRYLITQFNSSVSNRKKRNIANANFLSG